MIYLLVRIISGPPGHGEPGQQHIALMDDGDAYTLGKPIPAFFTKEQAIEFKKINDKYNLYKILELSVMPS